MIGQIQPKTFIVHKLHTKSIRNQNNLFIAKEKQSKNYHGLSKMFIYLWDFSGIDKWHYWPQVQKELLPQINDPLF